MFYNRRIIFNTLSIDITKLYEYIAKQYFYATDIADITKTKN